MFKFRDLDRERAKLEGQEKKIIADIKKMAKQGQMVFKIIYNIFYINLLFCKPDFYFVLIF